MKNRYIFFKRLFKDYVIVFLKHNHYYSMGIDKSLIEYLDNNDINYIVLDEKNNVYVNKKVKNNYVYYVEKVFLKKLLVYYSKRW